LLESFVSGLAFFVRAQVAKGGVRSRSPSGLVLVLESEGLECLSGRPAWPERVAEEGNPLARFRLEQARLTLLECLEEGALAAVEGFGEELLPVVGGDFGM
jgi:hypothetical protein